MRHILTVLVVAGAASLLPSPPARTDDSADLAEKAVAAHSAGLAEIRTLSAKLELSAEVLPDATVPSSTSYKPGDQLPVQKGDYFYSGDRMRIVEREGPLAPRTLIRDLRAKKTFRLPGVDVGLGNKKTTAAVSDGDPGTHLDLSNGYIFYLPRPVPPKYETSVSLASAVAMARKVEARRETLEGSETVRLDLTLDDAGNQFQVWLDVKANYAFRRILNIGPNGTRIETKILEYCELAPGIFCPARAERILPKLTKAVLVVSNVQVNKPLPESLFSTKLPSGSQVVDQVEGKVYQVGNSGTPDKVVGRVITPPSIDRSEPSTAPTPLFADEPKQFSWSRIVLASSLALAVVGAVLWYRRRKAVV
ncbi:MAG: outer membrane lipoprotein-sorting protein [Planctomycetia bacterium]|nr:outer membrane lipoprotein-sorting protein [Planctomycetia bacterium]